jgi:lactoylglutathione lyase
MKGLAFVKDPDGYWVELVSRGENAKISNECNFSQTMLRVKDPKKSLEFYQKMGMKLLYDLHFDDFSLYFLGSSVVPDGASPKDMFQPVLELTHNHGTENDDAFKYFNGNEDERKGFGHIGFLVDDVYKACDEIAKMGYGFKKVSGGSDAKPKTKPLVSIYSLLTDETSSMNRNPMAEP